MRLLATMMVLGSMLAAAQPAAAENHPDFCANLKLAVSHAPKGFTKVRGYGHAWSAAAVVQRELVHSTTLSLQPNAQCKVASREHSEPNNGSLHCLSRAPAGGPGAEARAGAMFAHIKACLPGPGTELAPGASLMDGVFDAEIRRGGVSVVIMSTADEDYISIGTAVRAPRRWK